MWQSMVLAPQSSPCYLCISILEHVRVMQYQIWQFQLMKCLCETATSCAVDWHSCHIFWCKTVVISGNPRQVKLCCQKLHNILLYLCCSICIAWTRCCIMHTICMASECWTILCICQIFPNFQPQIVNNLSSVFLCIYSGCGTNRKDVALLRRESGQQIIGSVWKIEREDIICFLLVFSALQLLLTKVRPRFCRQQSFQHNKDCVLWRPCIFGGTLIWTPNVLHTCGYEDPLAAASARFKLTNGSDEEKLCCSWNDIGQLVFCCPCINPGFASNERKTQLNGLT